jgi:hypothetical protein
MTPPADQKAAVGRDFLQDLSLMALQPLPVLALHDQAFRPFEALWQSVG